MTPEPDTPRTPLTLEFEPDPMEGDEQSQPIVIAEPSFQHDGRIFCAVHPFGRRVGCHLLPQDARTLRDHLSKLLLEPNEDGLPADYEPPATDWHARIQKAAARAATKKIKKRLAHFRFEGQVGRFAFVIGTTSDDRP